jgi:hypothetical protein
MAIKFALKDNDPKSASGGAGKTKTEAKAVPAPIACDDSIVNHSGSDLFDGEPAEQKRKRRK